MPKIVDHLERRAEIAAAAARAIDEHGLDRVRLVDVARCAACTTGAVSHYFPDKDAVLAAALEHVLGNLSTYAPRSEPWPESMDPVDSFLGGLAEMLPLDEPRRRDWRVWIAFCGRAVSTPALAALHRDAYAEIQQALASVLCDVGVASPGPDAHRLAVAVFAAFDGLGLRATLEPTEWPSERLRSMLAYQLGPLLRTQCRADDFETNPQAQERSA
jgi:TetR/AcrR family transcriptional repressor of bet genes